MSSMELHGVNETAAPDVTAQARTLGNPSQKAGNALWIIVVLILAGVIFAGGLFGMLADGSDETALYGFVGLALGALIGLLSPPLNSGSKAALDGRG